MKHVKVEDAAMSGLVGLAVTVAAHQRCTCATITSCIKYSAATVYGISMDSFSDTNRKHLLVLQLHDTVLKCI